jgi:hypothetical protein
LLKQDRCLERNSADRFNSGQVLNLLNGKRNATTASSNSWTNVRLASCSQDKSIKIWTIPSGECLRTINASTGYEWLLKLPYYSLLLIFPVSIGYINEIVGSSPVRCLAVIDDTKLASGCSSLLSYGVKVWNISNGLTDGSTLTGHTERVSCLAVLSENLLASGSWDKRINIWDMSTGKCLRDLREHTSLVLGLAVLPKDGGQLASCSADQTIKIWQISTGECLQTLKGHTGPVCCLAVLVDDETGCRLASGSSDETIKIWDFLSGEFVMTRELKGHTGLVACLGVLKGSQQLLASGGCDGTIKIWQTSNGECLSTLKGHTKPVWCLCVLNESRLASGSGDKSIKIWQISTGECLQTLYGHSGSLLDLKLLP